MEVIPDGAAIEASEEETILQALLGHGLAHAHVCGSKARCSICGSLVLEELEFCSPAPTKNRDLQIGGTFHQPILLACQTQNSDSLIAAV